MEPCILHFTEQWTHFPQVDITQYIFIWYYLSENSNFGKQVLSWCLEHCLVRMNIITLFDLPVSCPASALALTPGTETIFSVLPPFVTHQIILTAAPSSSLPFHPSLPPSTFGSLARQYISQLVAFCPFIPLHLLMGWRHVQRTLHVQVQRHAHDDTEGCMFHFLLWWVEVVSIKRVSIKLTWYFMMPCQNCEHANL